MNALLNKLDLKREIRLGEFTVPMNNERVQNTTDSVRNALLFQFDISWKLLEYHLTSLEDDECLWRPCSKGLHVRNIHGNWHADWPDTESYDIGPPSIAWLTWHITFWWSMALDYSFGSGTLTREQVQWPGSMIAFKEKVVHLRNEWRKKLETVPDEELLSYDRTKWPFKDKTFYELAAWLNLELMKNASEIGYCRFLYASRNQ